MDDAGVYVKAGPHALSDDFREHARASIMSEIERLDGTIGSLAQRIATLAKALDSVLAVAPDPAEERGMNAVESMDSKAVRMLQSLCDDVVSLEGVVLDLIRRVQI